jgi:hypothetical protein
MGLKNVVVMIPFDRRAAKVMEKEYGLVRGENEASTSWQKFLLIF